MKQDNKQVLEALVLVFQFGINMIVPILMCTLLGVWIGQKFQISWITIPLFFVGALAGATNIYKMSKKLCRREEKKDKKNVKKNK